MAMRQFYRLYNHHVRGSNSLIQKINRKLLGNRDVEIVTEKYE